MGLFRVWDWEMFRLHVLGETAEEFPALNRPFPVPASPFAGLLAGITGPPADAEPEAAPAGAGAARPAAAVPRVEIVDDDEEPKKTK